MQTSSSATTLGRHLEVRTTARAYAYASSTAGMMRIYKSYRLPYRIGGSASNATQPVPAVHMTFPSYPAVPFSLDDFYQTSAGMVGLISTEGPLRHSHARCRLSLKPR